jgi:hypothetical protein
MRRFLAGGIAVCMLSLFVPPTGALREVALASTATRTSPAVERTVAPQSERTPAQRELSPNAALLLIMTVALRGLHGS